MIDTAVSKHKAEAIIMTAAASQLCRMMLRIADQKGLPVICIVRREEQEKLLREEFK